MAKDRRKLLHIHSSVPDKQPTAASLEVGEIAVNNAKDQEFLSLKNSDNKVVRFSSDNNIINWVERKEVIPYSGVVDNVHLDTNRSNIEIKLNQVVASATTKHDKVNGARDIDNNLVNPTTDGGITDGAGFAIDMSRYAMIGANPSFSSVTSTCGATLKGTTQITGGDGSCGSKFTVNTNKTDIVSCEELKLDSRNLILSTNSCGGGEITIDTKDLCLAGDETATLYGEETNVGIDCDGSKSATTTNIYGNELNIKANTGVESIKSNKTVNVEGNTNITTSGNTAIHSYGRFGISSNGELSLVSSEDNIVITANDDICESAGSNASFFGNVKTNIGLNCQENASAATTNVYGSTVNTYANNFNVSGNTTISGNTNIKNNFTVSGNTNISGNTTINKNITVKGNTYLSGNTYFNNTCEDIESNELSNALCEVLNKAITSASTDVTVTASTPSTTGNVYKTYTVQQDGVNKEVGIEIPNLTITESAGDVKSYTIKYNGVERSTITIPKDLVVTSGSVVRGTWNGDTFTKNPNGPDTAIELVIANDESQKIYINTADLVKDSVYSSSTDSITIVTGYSAGHQDVDINMKKGHAVLKITHNGLVNKEYDPAVSGETLVLPHSALTITYGATSGKSGSVTYNTSSATSVTIPTSVCDLNRGSLTVQTNGTTIGTFDGCSNKTINIPIPEEKTSVCELERGSLTLTQGSTVLGTYDPCSSNTINIPAAVIPSANPLNICYDNTCGESGCVTYDTSSAITVNIPATIAHVTCGDIVDSNAGTSGAVITSNAQSTTINSSGATTLNAGDTIIDSSSKTVVKGGQGPNLTLSGQGATLDANYTSVKGNAFAEITAGGEVDVYGTGSTSTVNVSGGTTNVNGTTVNVSGTTTEISSKNSTTISSSSGPVCIETADIANLYGKRNTNVGISCNGTKTTGNTVVYGENTEVIGATSVTVSGGTSAAISGGVVSIHAIGGINIIDHSPAPNVGNINISTGERLTLNGKNTDITGNSAVAISSGNKVNVTSYGTSVQSVDISAISGGTRLSTYKNLAVRTTGDTSIVSTGNTSINGSGVTVSALERLDLKATNSPAPGVNAGVINLDAFEINAKNCYNANIEASNLILNGISQNKISSQGGVKIETLSDYGRTEIISSGNTNITTKSATTISSDTVSIRAVGSGKTSADTSINITASNGKVSTNGDSIYSRSRAGITEFTSSREVRLESYDRYHAQGSGITMILGDGCLSIDGDVCVDGKITATGAIYSSDERLKENIRNIPYDKVMASSKIMLKEFNFKDDETKRKTYGVIAQDVIKAGLVDIVHEKEDGMYGVDYTSLLILKNQFLDEQLRIMSSKIRNLERKIEELNKKD